MNKCVIKHIMTLSEQLDWVGDDVESNTPTFVASSRFCFTALPGSALCIFHVELKQFWQAKGTNLPPILYRNTKIYDFNDRHNRMFCYTWIDRTRNNLRMSAGGS